MTQLTRHNGNLARRQPPPQRREPERIPADGVDDGAIYVVQRDWTPLVLALVACTIFATVVSALLLAFVMSLPAAVFGG